jgi:hypothetical protein
MARMWKAAALLAVLTVAARAQDREGPNLPPWITKAYFNRDGKFVFQLVVPDVREEVREVEVIRGGRRVKEKRRVPVENPPKIVNQTIDAKGVRVYDAEGNPVKLETARRALTRLTPVAVSADGRKVDPAYLRLFRKGTFVLVLPPPPAPEKGRPPERP